MSKTVDRSQQEISEIERHKYYLSEKAGYDVGWDHAANDWEEKHSGEFRRIHAAPVTQNAAPGGRGISYLFRRLFSKSSSPSDA